MTGDGNGTFGVGLTPSGEVEGVFVDRNNDDGRLGLDGTAEVELDVIGPAFHSFQEAEDGRQRHDRPEQSSTQQETH